MKMGVLENMLSRRKAKEGEVKFPTSSETDSHIQNIAAHIAQAKGIPVQEVFAKINEGVQQAQQYAQVAPILYHTLKQNLVENELFQQFQDAPVQVPNSPKFSNITFQKLIRSIRADHDEFFPLRSFVDKRRLINPKFSFDTTAPTDGPKTEETKNKFRVPTAAATPHGEFIFNVPFMQKLMDYAHLKGIKPQGKKYKSNGGDIPDEYAYLEFLIMHEFMHYSNDDFYYQKIIPNANPMIINWVGDFRSNYILTKSGYEALPIGLFNDKINYDRQKTYVEMYDLVKSEFDKLGEKQKQELSDLLDKLSDDHKPGQSQGEKEDISGREVSPSDIDKNGKQIQKEVEGGKDSAPSDRGKNDGKGKGGGESNGTPGSGQNDGTSEVDYRSIAPRFNWRTLVQRFIMTSKPRTEETYARPHRRSVTGTHIIAQVGASAVKPAERPQDFSESGLAFVIDSSGSMSGVIAKVYANAYALLKQPAFAKTEQTLVKFSGGFEMYKINFASNKAGKVQDALQKPKIYDMKTTDVFSQHFGAGTVFDAAIAQQALKLVNTRHNVIFFLDSDILYGDNKVNFLNVLKGGGQHVFVIFDSRQTYISFRQQTGISTANITHFSE